MPKGQPHTIYKKPDGKRVPGVTTIIGVLAKPALIPWANKMGLQGIDTNRYVDELADAGTLAHDRILSHYTGEELDTSLYSEYQIELAGNSFLSYRSWASLHTIEPILLETPIVSASMDFGGTPDMLANVDGVSTLMDFKTGKAIYSEHSIQVAAYKFLIEEIGFTVEEIQILRIGRTNDEGFEVKPIKTPDLNWAIFLNCLSIYELQKAVNREEKT